MNLPPSTTPDQKAKSPASASWIIRSVFSNWFGLAANLIISFFMAPFIVHRLGDSSYGIWALMLQLTGYMGVVDVGLRSALVRFVSRLRAQNDHDGLNELLNSTLRLYAGFALLCLAGGSLIAFLALPYLHVPFNLLTAARNTLLLASVILASDFVFATFQGTLAGLSRWDLRNLISTSVLLLRSGLIIVVLSAGHGLVALALVQLGASLTGHALEIYSVRRLLPTFRLTWGTLRKKFLQPIFSHSANSMLIGLGVGINYEIDAIVIAAFLPVREVTFYVIGFNLIKYLRDLINVSSMIVAPLASHFDAQGQSQGVSSLLVRGSKYTLLLAYLGCAGLLCIGPDFIRVWMGNEYAARSGIVVTVLAIGLFFSLTENIGAHLLFGLGKHRVNVWCTGGEALLNLAASIFLVRRYGIYGVAAGTSIAAFVVRGWFFPNAALKILHVRWREYLIGSIAPTIVPALAFAAGALTMRHFVHVHGYGSLCLVGVAGLLVYLPCLWNWGLDSGERKQLLGLLNGVFIKLSKVNAVPGRSL